MRTLLILMIAGVLCGTSFAQQRQSYNSNAFYGSKTESTNSFYPKPTRRSQIVVAKSKPRSTTLRRYSGQPRYYPGTATVIRQEDYRFGQAYSIAPVVPVYVVPLNLGPPIHRAPRPNPNYYRFNRDCK